MCNGNIRKVRRIHQLVAMAFLGHVPCGFKLVVNHIDLDRLNSVLEIVLGYTNDHAFAYARWEGMRDNFNNSAYVEHLDGMLNPPGT